MICFKELKSDTLDRLFTHDRLCFRTQNVFASLTHGLDDEASLYHLLMGRCAAVLRTGDFEKMCEQEDIDTMVDAERDLFTFAVECFYFSPDCDGIGAASAARPKIRQNWETLAKAHSVQLNAGVQLCAGSTVSMASSNSKFAGHLGFPIGGATVFPYARRLKFHRCPLNTEVEVSVRTHTLSKTF